MPTLSNARLTIKLIAGSHNAEVTGTVNTAFIGNEPDIIKQLGLTYSLGCKLRGDDGDTDRDLFSFQGKSISTSGESIFQQTLNRDLLNEDIKHGAPDDEVYARFTLKSNEALLPIKPVFKDSQTIVAGF